jgi:uncharacterized protein (DUF362 family)
MTNDETGREMSGISRRDFIKAGVGIAAATLLPRRLFGAEPAASGPVVAVASGDNAKLVKAAVDELGGIAKFIKTGDKVAIKPNISFAANAECGATTSAGIVKQVVELCLAAGAAKVVIVDHTIADSKLCVDRSGISEAIVDPKKVSLLLPNEERQYEEVSIPGATELKTVKVVRAVRQADKLINLPTAKSHSATGVSLGMKNLMGLTWDRGTFHMKNLHRAIAELSTVIRPNLVIVDATRALTSGGPGGPGKTARLDKVVAGSDPVAVDAYTVGLTQWYNKSFTGKSVKYIVAANELGLGEIDTTKMRIKSVSV